MDASVVGGHGPQPTGRNPHDAARLWLGSGSPQRRAMLQQAGYMATARPPHLDDGQLTPGDVGPEEWTLALACWKARAVAESLRAEGARGVVLAGDTVCTHRGEVMGKPRNQDHARVMLQAFRSATHPVVTGVCLIDLDRDEEQSFVDVARVRWGSVPDEAIESYLQSDGWKGRAGGYNLADRINDGWDIAAKGSGHRDGLAFAAAGTDAGRYGIGTIPGRQPMTQGPAGPWSALLRPFHGCTDRCRPDRSSANSSERFG